MVASCSCAFFLGWLYVQVGSVGDFVARCGGGGLRDIQKVVGFSVAETVIPRGKTNGDVPAFPITA